MTLQQRTSENYSRAERAVTSTIDRMMGVLLILEWIGIVATALFGSPFTWDGTVRHFNPHFISALLSGPSFILPAAAAAFLFQGRILTRHLIAVSQILVSVVLIDITGGRIESHFFIFGSLAFLAAYRDWRVLITATIVTAADHLVRGIWWPLSVYGDLTSSPFRFIEHVWWVVFEDVFLIITIRKGVAEMHEIAGAKARLYEDANHDVLTGLANRRFLAEKWSLSMAVDAANTKALLFIDLDRFKQVNDMHGHFTGDKLLTKVAERLTECFPEPAILARIGGDEFVVLLEGSGGDSASMAGALALEALNVPFLLDGLNLLLSATVGAALYPEHGTTLPELQEKADQAMYLAKSQGRNQVNIFSGSDQHCKDVSLELSCDLFQAVQRDELRLDFQPIVARTGEISSFEALLRWHHPHLGLISPSEFIPIAERSGLIIPVGDWVLLEACRQCRSWQKPGSAPVGVAVNVSALQLRQPDFSVKVEHALLKADLPPSLLTLELTESVLISDLSQAGNDLQRLRSLGVRIALDDFGTGYSSLTYLSELPLDAIKLDRAFIQNQLTKASTVLGSVVEMAHRRGLCVVAEGVEQTSEANRLRVLGCDQLQGYIFSRPIAASFVPQFLALQVGDVEMQSILEPTEGLLQLTA